MDHHRNIQETKTNPYKKLYPKKGITSETSVQTTRTDSPRRLTQIKSQKYNINIQQKTWVLLHSILSLNVPFHPFSNF